MERLEELYESRDRKEDSSCNSCSVKIIADSSEESSPDSSKSTLDRSQDKLEFSKLWMALHKFENLCRVLQVWEEVILSWLNDNIYICLPFRSRFFYGL